jgi:hypothetical protein
VPVVFGVLAGLLTYALLHVVARLTPPDDDPFWSSGADDPGD